jgi:hypothetical protein
MFITFSTFNTFSTFSIFKLFDIVISFQGAPRGTFRASRFVKAIGRAHGRAKARERFTSVHYHDLVCLRVSG